MLKFQPITTKHSAKSFFVKKHLITPISVLNAGPLDNPLMEIRSYLFCFSRIGSTKPSDDVVFSEHGIRHTDESNSCRPTMFGWVEISLSGICYCKSLNIMLEKIIYNEKSLPQLHSWSGEMMLCDKSFAIIGVDVELLLPVIAWWTTTTWEIKGMLLFASENTLVWT